MLLEPLEALPPRAVQPGYRVVDGPGVLADPEICVRQDQAYIHGLRLEVLVVGKGGRDQGGSEQNGARHLLRVVDTSQSFIHFTIKTRMTFI